MAGPDQVMVFRNPWDRGYKANCVQFWSGRFVDWEADQMLTHEQAEAKRMARMFEAAMQGNFNPGTI